MPISKLTGPMLSNILVRDGQSVAFSDTANSTPLLYLDVANARIGVNTDAPTTDFTINGPGFANSFNLTNSLSLGGNVVALGDVFSANVSASGNITTINLTAAGYANAINISASGNINAFANIFGDNINANNVSASGNINAFANISGGNININSLSSTANLSVTGTANVNLLNVANISVSGNISGNASTSTTGNVNAGNITITGSAQLGNIVIIDTTISSMGNIITFAGTAGIAVPVGDTSQRPSTPPTGTLRFNSENDSLETWDGSQWVNTSAQPSTIFDQQITGTNVTTYPLTESVSDNNNIIVSINGITQLPGTAYNVVGSNIEFASPLLTSEVADIRYLTYPVGVSDYGNANVAAYLGSGVVSTVVANTITTTNNLTLAVYANDTARNTAIPTPTAGMLIFNTAAANFQGYNGTAWGNLALS